MPTKTQQNVEPQPSTNTGGVGTQPETVETIAELPAETAEKVVQFDGRKGGTNGFAAFNAKQSSAIQGKVQLVKEAKAELTKAHEAAVKGDIEDAKASEPAAKGGLLLFTGMTQGILTNDEVSDILGATFGFKVKKDGTDSKTPEGLGEDIRKRVQRAFKGFDYAIAGNEPVAFYEPLEREDVQPLVESVINGTIGLWEFYNQSGELKAEKTGKRPKAAFDPRRIAAMTRDWGQNIGETVAIVQRTPGLFQAMAGMLRMLETIGGEMPVVESNKEAA